MGESPHNNYNNKEVDNMCYMVDDGNGTLEERPTLEEAEELKREWESKGRKNVTIKEFA